jgi:restriction system protein
MISYYKIMLGKGSVHAAQGIQDGFVGVDYEMPQDLKDHLPEDWRDFNEQFIPVYLANHPGKTKIAAGLACGMLWTVCKALQIGDVVLSPSGQAGVYRVGDVTGGYSYHPNEVLPHRRAVSWRSKVLKKEEMSAALVNSAGSIGAVVNLSKYADELRPLLTGDASPPLVIGDDVVEDLATFQLEKQLETFLVDNWSSTELGQKYDIYRDEDGALAGQQFKTDTGPLDILAISKDKKELLVVELKRGRTSDRVVGQVQRYMGHVLKYLAEEGQTVKGAIIALEDDPRVRLALLVAPNISFYTYQISFKLKQMGSG